MEKIAQNISDQDLFVGYVITFEGGKPDKVGRFPLAQSGSDYFGIFKEMLRVEPSVRQSCYIFGSIRPDHSFSSYLETIEFKKADIEKLLHRLAKPGIVKRF